MPGAVDWMAGVVVAWLQTQTPDALEALARQDVDIAHQVWTAYRPYLALARRWSAPYLESLRAADAETWDRILDRVLQQCPAQGLVCWRHRAWFHRQLGLARQHFVGE